MKTLPCPFCGSEKNPVKKNERIYILQTIKTEEEIGADFYLECDNCSLVIGKGNSDDCGDYYCDFSTEKDALNFWNNRKI